jgi:hypothetical protein
MTPIDQVHGALIDGELGDCWRACIASIVELSAAEVPHFAEEFGIEHMTAATASWLRARGLTFRYVHIAGRELETLALDDDGVLRAPYRRCSEPLPDYLVVTGFSGTRHSVVVETAPYRAWVEQGQPGGRPPVAHDPNPTRSGIDGVYNAWAIVLTSTTDDAA